MDKRYESKFQWYKAVLLDVSLVTIVLAIVVMSKANVDHVEARITEMAQEQILLEQQKKYWELKSERMLELEESNNNVKK